MSKEIHPIIKEMNLSQPNPRLVNSLTRMLARAETGELQVFIGCFIFDNQTVDDVWVDPPQGYHTCVLSDRIVGSLHRLAHKLLTIGTQSEMDFFFYSGDDPEGA